MSDLKQSGTFGQYTFLSLEEQVGGLKQRAAQLEGEHMSLVLRRVELDAELEADENVSDEMAAEAYKAVDKSLASVNRRLSLIEKLIKEYEGDGK